MLLRAEEEGDRRAIQELHEAAFDSAAEARLVAALREQARPVVSLVAEEDAVVVGHVMFSPVVLDGHPGLRIMGLAPMAVAPAHQRRGIGCALARSGLARCGEPGFDAVVVLGHAAFYPRFGFVPAWLHAIGCEYDVPREVFMILELRPGALRGAAGTARYHAAFASL